MQTVHGGVLGDGKSGQLFFLSADERFVIKTLKTEACVPCRVRIHNTICVK